MYNELMSYSYLGLETFVSAISVTSKFLDNVIALPFWPKFR